MFGLVWAGLLPLCLPVSAMGADEKAPPARPKGKPAPQATPAARGLNLDELLEQLARIDPKVLADRLAGIRARIQKLDEESASLHARLKKNEAELGKLRARVQLLDALVRARQAGVARRPAAKPKPGPKPKAKPKAQQPKAASKPKAKPKPKPKPLAKAAPQPAAARMAPPAKPAQKKPAPKKPAPAKKAGDQKASAPASLPIPNFAEHILPIFRVKCFNCHNPDKSKGGLVLVSHEELMLGGSSGDVIQPGAPQKSRLFRLVSHLDTPHMPAKQPRLEDSQLDLIRRWIAGGALPDAAATGATPSPVAADAPMKTPGPPPLKPQVHPLPAVALAASPAAPILAVGGNEQVLLYHAESRALLGVLDFPEGRLQQLAFSADGAWLLAAGGRAGESGTAVLFDTESMQRAGRFDRLYDTALAAAVSPDGGAVAVGGSHKRVRVFDGFDGTKLFEIDAHNDWIRAIAFSPDGLLLATADRAGGLFVWESDTGREVHHLRGHTGAVSGLAFRADGGVLASCGRDGTVRLWEMENGRAIRQWRAHDIAALDIAFTADGRLVTCGADGRTRLWQQDGKLLRDFPKQKDWLYRLAPGPGAGWLATGCWSGEVTIFETATGKVLGTLSTAPRPPAREARISFAHPRGLH